MKRWTSVVCLIVIALCVSGCASLTYESADGSRVTYTRILTGSDSIRGTLPGASIESTGRQAVDPAVLSALVQVLSAAK